MKILILLLVVALGTIAAAVAKPNSKKVLNENKKNISVSLPINTPTLTSTPTSTPPPSRKQNTILKYPDSVQTGSDASAVYYESQDNAQVITDWYKEKIRSFGMNTKSFVQTKTNDNVLNKLAGAGGNKEINIEITRKSGESTVKIKVNTQYPIDNQKTF